MAQMLACIAIALFLLLLEASNDSLMVLAVPALIFSALAAFTALQISFRA
jgi:hypothetical protein